MNVPWIEKYRPKEFHEIVLNTQNKTFIQNKYAFLWAAGYWKNNHYFVLNLYV